MSQINRLAKNTVIQLIGRVFGTIFGVLTVAAMTRALGTEGYGQFTIAFTYLAIAAALADFGFTLTTTQMISEDGADEEKIISNAFTMRLISGAFFFVLAGIVAQFMPYSPVIKLTIVVGAFSFFFMTASQMLIGIYQKHLAMWRPALAEALSRGVILALVIILAANQTSVAHMMGAFMVGNFFMLLMNFGFALRYSRVKLRIDPAVVRIFVKRSWPIAVSVVFNLLYLKGDIVFMNLLGRSDAEIGLYGAAYKVLDVVVVVPSMFMGLLLPMITNAWTKNDLPAFREALQRAFDLFSLVAFPIMFGTFLVAGPVLALVAGDEFLAAAPYLTVLIIANTFVYFGILFAHAIVGMGRQKLSLIGFFAVAIVSVVLYLVTIPRFGAIGAAWTTTISEALIALILGGMVFSIAKFRPALKSSFISLICAIIMMFAVSLLLAVLPPTTPALLLVIAIAAVLYAGSVLLFGGVKLETVKQFVSPSSS